MPLIPRAPSARLPAAPTPRAANEHCYASDTLSLLNEQALISIRSMVRAHVPCAQSAGISASANVLAGSGGPGDHMELLSTSSGLPAELVKTTAADSVKEKYDASGIPDAPNAPDAPSAPDAPISPETKKIMVGVNFGATVNPLHIEGYAMQREDATIRDCIEHAKVMDRMPGFSDYWAKVNGHAADLDKTLLDAGVREGMVIYAVPRMRGGAGANVTEPYAEDSGGSDSETDDPEVQMETLRIQIESTQNSIRSLQAKLGDGTCTTAQKRAAKNEIKGLTHTERDLKQKLDQILLRDRNALYSHSGGTRAEVQAAERAERHSRRMGGSMSAVAEVHGATKSSRKSKKREPVASLTDASRTVFPELTLDAYTRIRSTGSVIELANKWLSKSFKDAAYNLGDIPPVDTHLTGKVSSNITKFERDGYRQAAAAIIACELALVQSKSNLMLGLEAISDGKRCSAPGHTQFIAHMCRSPEELDPHRRGEVIVAGLTQSSKSPDEAHLAWFSIYILGLQPVIFIRNSGGKSVGSSDMSKAVKKHNDMVKRVWDSVKHRYPDLRSIPASEFYLRPRCTSRNEMLDMSAGNPHQLEYTEGMGRQVMISCTNITQLSTFVSPGKSSKGLIAKRATFGQNGLPLCEIFSGFTLLTGDASSPENNYLPYMSNPEVDILDPAKPVLPAIMFIYDEDDCNQVGSGGPAKIANLQHKMCAWAKTAAALNKHVKPSNEEEEEEEFVLSPNPELGMDEGQTDDVTTADEKADAEFKERSAGIRASGGLNVGFTATPTHALFDTGPRDTYVETTYKMINMVPPPTYIGFATSTHNTYVSGHKKFIEVRSDGVMDNRDKVLSYSITAAFFKYVKRVHDTDLENLPEHLTEEQAAAPWKRNRAGNWILSKRDRGALFCKRNSQGVVTGQVVAGDMQDDLRELVRKDPNIAGKLWYSDGNNLSHILAHMEANKSEYADGYRNMLFTTNHTTQEKGMKEWVGLIMGLVRSHEPVPGHNFDDSRLVKDLFVVEWFHKHVRITAADPDIDWDMLQAAIEFFKIPENNFCDDPEVRREMISFAKNYTMKKPDTDGIVNTDGSIGGSVCFNVSNINYAYSVLWKYREMRQRSRRSGDDPAFMKIIVIAGALAGRGCNFKTHDHKMVLTDIYHAFDVSDTASLEISWSHLIQTVGRACTCVRDVDAAPPIIYWTPPACNRIREVFMEANSEITKFNRVANMRPEMSKREVKSGLAAGQISSETLTDENVITTTFGMTHTTSDRKGPQGVYPGPNKAAAKADFRDALRVMEEEGRAPYPAIAHGMRTAEQLARSIENRAEEVANRRLAGGDDNDRIRGAPSGVVPSRDQPAAINLARATPRVKERKRKQVVESFGASKWQDDELDRAIEAASNIVVLRKNLDHASDLIFIELLVYWFKMLTCIPGLVRHFGTPGIGGSHRLMDRKTRGNYITAIESVSSHAGKEFFKELGHLPLNEHTDPIFESIAKDWADDALSHSVESTRESIITRIKKIKDLFPHNALRSPDALRSWLRNTEPPSRDDLRDMFNRNRGELNSDSQRPPAKRSRTHETPREQAAASMMMMQSEDIEDNQPVEVVTERVIYPSTNAYMTADAAKRRELSDKKRGKLPMPSHTAKRIRGIGFDVPNSSEHHAGYKRSVRPRAKTDYAESTASSDNDLYGSDSDYAPSNCSID